MAAVPLRIALERIAGELARLRNTNADAQDAAGLLIEAASTGMPIPDAALLGLQALDALGQHLAALSAFLVAMAAELPEGVRVDPGAALREPPLASLRARLLGEAASTSPEAEVELF